MKNYKKKIKLDIRSFEWTIYLFTLENYNKEVGDDSRGVTEVEKHELYFNTEYLTMPIIRHELTHALIESYGHYNIEYTQEQLEEVLCSIMEFHYEYVQQLAKKIYKKLKG